MIIIVFDLVNKVIIR